MVDAHAEAKRPHARRVGHLLPNLFEYPPGPGVVGREDVGQFGDVIPTAPPPRHVAKIHAVVNAEVVERGQVVLVDSVPEA